MVKILNIIDHSKILYTPLVLSDLRFHMILTPPKVMLGLDDGLISRM